MRSLAVLRGHRVGLLSFAVVAAVACLAAGISAAATPKATNPAPVQGGLVLSMARLSVNQVVLLHDLAVGATHLAGAPPGIGAPQAAQLARTLKSEGRQLAAGTKNGNPRDVAALASALSGYAGLATQLGRRPASDTARLSKAFVKTLRGLDAKWRPAVVSIGRANHVNLLAKMPPLLIPKTG